MTKRRQALKEAAKLDESKRAAIAGFLVVSLRQQRGPDVQKALAESISGLAQTPAVAATAAEELRRMAHGSLTSIPGAEIELRSGALARVSGVGR